MKRLAIVIGLALCAVASDASAGLFISVPVAVYAGSGAQGSMQAARFSSDGNQYIGCQVTASGGSNSAYCFARDSSANYISCYTTDASAIQNAGSVSSGSFVLFQVSGSTCTYVSVTNSSYFLQ
jgi:hypothetical protein